LVAVELLLEEPLELVLDGLVVLGVDDVDDVDDVLDEVLVPSDLAGVAVLSLLSVLVVEAPASDAVVPERESVR